LFYFTAVLSNVIAPPPDPSLHADSGCARTSSIFQPIDVTTVDDLCVHMPSIELTDAPVPIDEFGKFIF
jgi:hypothetical protein